MKPLYTYILEARGIVTGENNWSNLVEYIVDHCDFDQDGEFVITQRQYLPPWIGSCIVRLEDWVPGGIAAYADDESVLVGNQMEVTIKVTKQALISTNKFRITLEHELQHAFDHWVKVFRRGKTNFIDDTYCIPIGYEGPEFDEIRFWDIYDDPSKCYFDHMFYILRESTYWFDQSESNAFLREFALYLKEFSIKNGQTWDWNNLYDDPNETGAQPLIGIMLIHCVLDHPNIYHDVEWDYVMDGLNATWAPTFMGKTYSGEDAKAFCKVLQDILNKKAKKVLDRYIRVFKDSGLQCINEPEWFKV